VRSLRQSDVEISAGVGFNSQLLDILHAKLLVVTVVVWRSPDMAFRARGNEDFEP